MAKREFFRVPELGPVRMQLNMFFNEDIFILLATQFHIPLQNLSELRKNFNPVI